MPNNIENNQHTQRKHFELGGSSASRWMNCTASVALIRTVPPLLPGPSAEEGEKAHELAQICLEDFLDHKLNGTDPEIRYHLLSGEAPEEMTDAVQAYKKVIWEKVLEHSITKKAFGIEDEVIYDAELNSGGIVDFWCASINDKGELQGVVVDFKYGFQEVEVSKNPQLYFYLACLRKLLADSDKKLDSGKVCIYQPRSQGEKFKIAKVTLKQLYAFEVKMNKAFNEIYSPNKAKYKVGDWCRWCPAQAVCPSYTKTLQEKSQLSLIRAKDKILPKPQKLSDDALATILSHRSEIRDFLDACEAYGVSRYLEGSAIPGTKVVERKGRRQWLDDIALVGDRLKAAGVQYPYEKKLKTISQMERLVPEQVIAEITKISKPSQLLVDVSDERPGVESYIKMLEKKDGTGA